MEPREAIDQKTVLLKLNERITRREMQLHLIHEIIDNNNLMNSKILSSVCPKVGKVFGYRDLELKKVSILAEARQRILKECAVVEADRDILKLCNQIFKHIRTQPNNEEVTMQLDYESERIRCQVQRLHQKKKDFHLGNEASTPDIPVNNPKRRKWRNMNTVKKREANKRYRENKKKRKKEWLNNKVKEISSTVVRNLSSVTVPNEAYLYLAKGLNFVESKKASKEDLKYDTQEFLRKLEWKAFFHENPVDDSFNEDDHQDLRIPSRKHPDDYSNPLMDDIRTKIMGFVGNIELETPASNLTAAEKRGKSWVIQKIEQEQIFVTKADKGGSTLILDYSTAINCVKQELGNNDKFDSTDGLAIDTKMKEVQTTVNSKVLELASEGKITEKDKTLITGLNQNNNLMHAHVFKSVVPYVYPLFKLHKLSLEQIQEKTTPPIRLVHATREGPLYRLEKWVSPYLTQVSRAYCEDEFLLDSPDLIAQIQTLNSSAILNNCGSNVHLFTLDVISLYPSIDPELALTALHDALNNGRFDDTRGTVVHDLTDVIFKNSFVCFHDRVYTSKKGIPTGNCVSRQMADVTLHWLLFLRVKPQMEQLWSLIRFWKRFIDDVFGLWVGSVRQFHLFVKKLNELSKPFGIQFGDFQIGKTVNFLDIKFTLNEDSKVEFKLYTKETDARLYLKTDSFHPSHVFKSVVFSQMIRVIQRNSKDSTCIEDLHQLKADLIKSGHKSENLEATEPLAVQRAIENELGNNLPGRTPKENQLVFAVKYFKEVDQLKQLIHTTRDDIKQLCGDIKLTFALRKQPSIGNTVLKNRHLSEQPTLTDTSFGPIDQKCGGRGCQTCPYLFDSNDIIMVNGSVVFLDFKLTCKTKNVIYIAQCQICKGYGNMPYNDDAYFGQTVSAMHIRMNGHRSKFIINSSLLFEKSALSMHCFLAHKEQFDMNLFKLGIVKRVRPVDLDREESKLINSYRTNIWGLNRISVVR